MDFREFLNRNTVILDGACGTMMQAMGTDTALPTEKQNITAPEIVIKIHKAYFDAGSDVVSTNTFGVNAFKYTEKEIDTLVKAAVENAKAARKQTVLSGEKFIALDIGPTGKLLAPLGDCAFEDAVSSFAAVIKCGVKYGVDLIFIETMNDCYETKAALLAAKENSSLPVLVSNAYGTDGRLMSGATPEVMTAMLEGMGADAVGVNCSFGPDTLKATAEKYLEVASVPVIFKPNAGLPRVENGVTVYDITPEEFAKITLSLVKKGVRLVGGCCGTTPQHIRCLKAAIGNTPPVKIKKKNKTVVSSYTKTAEFGLTPLLIGERLNPTGKKRLKEALKEKDINYCLTEALGQETHGADILDVNVGTPEVSESEMLPLLTYEIQSVCDLPLQLDTSDVSAMEKALRIYNGKPLINSVNGKKESMDSVFPLQKKYGGVVIALTLDENGIPPTVGGRVEIAKKILSEAAKYGIEPKDIVFDTLAMTVSADKNAANVTLSALKEIKEKLKCHTSLGVSNVSFGLPERSAVNAAFFMMALQKGLSAAIMNPYSKEMMSVYHSFELLSGRDENCGKYIAFATENAENGEAKPQQTGLSLKEAIVKGLKAEASRLAKESLTSAEPMELIRAEIIPALNTVGKEFEEKRVFLPQLLMSADAASGAFDEVKRSVKVNGSEISEKTVVIATVKGDIHDIGKNIVRLLLENYGFHVVDLGKNVDKEEVHSAIEHYGARLVGLSALMTTTLPSMEETVKLIKEKHPECKTVVGGAVLTEEYALKIGADFYAADAMDTVRYAESVFNK